VIALGSDDDWRTVLHSLSTGLESARSRTEAALDEGRTVIIVEPCERPRNQTEPIASFRA
jgi:hypothetical protein